MPEGTDSSHKKQLLIAALIVVAGILLAWRNASSDFWQRVQPWVHSLGTWLVVAATSLLVGGLLFSLYRSSRLLVAFLAATIVNVGLGIFLGQSREDLPLWLHYFLAGLQALTSMEVLIPVSIFSFVRLKGKLDRIRVASMIATIAIPALRLFAWWWGSDSLIFLSLIGSILTSLLLIEAAWCLAFYSVPAPHRPPVDAARHVSMTCPRCAAGIEIPAGHGECPHCRLQITISLEEGVCAKCTYPLRGLSGDKCPECGEPIVQNPSKADAALTTSA